MHNLVGGLLLLLYLLASPGVARTLADQWLLDVTLADVPIRPGVLVILLVSLPASFGSPLYSSNPLRGGTARVLAEVCALSG